jgi:hypothetical protein
MRSTHYKVALFLNTSEGQKMKLDEEQFTSSLTDQQYLVHRARLERDRDPCAAKVV